MSHEWGNHHILIYRVKQEANSLLSNPVIRVDERVKAIQGDMIHTGEYIAERFHDQNIYLQEHHAAIADALTAHQSGIGDALTTHHSNTAQMIGGIDGRVNSTLDALKHQGTFDLSVEILSDSEDVKQLAVLTTFNGDLADFSSLVVNGIIDGALEYVDPEFTPLGTGKVLLWMNSTASVFYLDAVATIADIEWKQSKLVNFGFC